jgi:hypothetical protein
MRLPECHSRLPLEDRTDLFLCAHPQVHAARDVVTVGICASCQLWKEPPPAKPRPLRVRLYALLDAPCRHLGPEIGLRECPSCGGHVRLKVFACRHPQHSETTLQECRGCGDFEPATATQQAAVP